MNSGPLKDITGKPFTFAPFTFAMVAILGMAAHPLTAAAQEQDIGEAATIASDDRITVEGQQRTRAEERAEIVEYVRRTGVARGQRPVARWIDPICPRVLGVSDEHGKIVADHIHAVASTVGAPVARAKCRPNMTIIFAESGRDTVAGIRRSNGSQFLEVPHGERDDVFDSNNPVRWWYRTQEQPSWGGQHSTGDPVFLAVETGPGAPQFGTNLGNANIMKQYRPSLVSTNTARAIRAASVVIDVNQADGFTLDSVSNYAAMVALAEMRQGTSGYNESILGLFEHPDRGDDLAERDIAFLTKLYSLPLDRSSRTQRGVLVRALLKESTAMVRN
ncbi:MAG: hypothetical protein AAFX04_09870 [Pseudomonadota bacterium]